MAVTLKDIAEKVGRSVTTVSRALYDYDDVSPETRVLVRRVAEEMGYSPNTLAQRLQKRRSDTIGLVIPSTGGRFADPFFTELLSGIGAKARQLGYDLLVSPQLPGENELEAYKRMVSGRRVDGFIVARTYRQDARILYLSERQIPFVAFGKIDGKIRFPFVDVDGAQGMRLVAEHLAQLGHQRIACITPPSDLTFTRYRLEGLRAGLAEFGLRLQSKYLLPGELTQRSGYEIARHLLDLPNPPSAIAACNDLMAFGAMRAAQEHGLNVGDDISITGFDDIPMAEHAHPPLTTVHQPVFEIGGLICEMLVKITRSELLEDQQLMIEPRLVVRQSTGEFYPV